jgi:hypothetical protein
MNLIILIIAAFIALAAGSTLPLVFGAFIALFIMEVKQNEIKNGLDKLNASISGLTTRKSTPTKEQALEKAIDDLNRRMTKLEERLQAGAALEKEAETSAEPVRLRELEKIERKPERERKPEPKPEAEPVPVEVPVETKPPLERIEPVSRMHVEKEPSIVFTRKRKSEFRKKFDDKWAQLQRQFVENWTGILGSVIMVMGVGFLGIYTALKVSPVYRFIMITVFSVLLMGLFFYLKSKSKWLKLALWLRSSSGAIFLFACLGSGFIDGLKWLDSPMAGLALLFLGIGVNLFLAFAGSSQAFASLHVLLSLTALSIPPPAPVILIVATIVTLFAIALTYREKWEYHLLLSITLFFAYHLYWFFKMGAFDLSRSQHLTAILCIVSVGVLALLVHYRSLYRTNIFERLPFTVHFMNWVYFATGLYLHSTGSAWKPVFLGAGALTAFFLARRARKLHIRWLFTTDTLMAQAIALFALFSLYKLEVEPFFILAMMLLETMLFLVVMIEEGERLLTDIAVWVKYALALVQTAWVFYYLGEAAGGSSMHVFIITLLTCAVFVTAFHVYLLKKFARDYHDLLETGEHRYLPYLMYFMHGFYVLTALYLSFTDWWWKPFAIAALAMVAFILARKAKIAGNHELYQTGTLLGQALALAALLALSQWHVKGVLIVGLMFVQNLLYLFMITREKDQLLCTVGMVIKYILAVILFGWGLSMVKIQLEMSVRVYRYLSVLLVCVLFAGGFHFYLFKKFGTGDRSLSAEGKSQWFLPAIYFIHFFYGSIGVYLYNLDWMWKPAAIMLLSITGFMVAKKAKTIGIKMLYGTGTLIAEAVAFLALASLSQWQVEPYFRTALMFIQVLLFLLLMIREKETKLRHTGTVTLIVIAFVLMVSALGNIDYTDTAALLKHAATLLVCMAWVLVYHIYTLKKFGESLDSFEVSAPEEEKTGYRISFVGILPGLLLLSTFILTYRLYGAEYILALMGIIIMFIRRKYSSNGLGAGLMVFVLGFHFFGWNNMNLTDDLNVLGKIIYSLPFLMLSAAGIEMPYISPLKRIMKALGIYLFYIHLMIATYYIFTRVSPFIAGALWLAFSIITLELSRRLRKKDSGRYLLHMGYLLTGAFLVRHMVVHLRVEQYAGILSLRLLVALLAIFTFTYWAWRKLPGQEESGSISAYLHPLFLELVFFFSIFTAAVEAAPRWFPMIWIAGALFCLIKGRSLNGEISRLRFYSLFLYWASTVYVALIPGIIGGGGISAHWYAKPWFINTAAIFFQFVYIILIHKMPFLTEIRFPKALTSLSSLAGVINIRKNLWIHYPLFISVALFLYYTFDRSILTFLWVVECFVIFISAVILKESHFRYLAMTGLGLSLIRLIFYDLAKSDTLTRALVFIGVGVLMLVMNSIYNKYKTRF